jgi:hypothetical protein
VMRDAPEEFRMLVNELASLQNVLRYLRDEINGDPGYVDKVGPERKSAIERAIGGTLQTLRSLEKLIHKYRSLGNGTENIFWKRLGWTTKQRDIENLRARIMVHATTLNLCMSR